ncbi:TadE/TadG family type IV pilus assembly protein [Breoghania sp. L-A4]|uniref:TadE/TadG family type IV pilus assembly protein n=1 Tax=Breoghania sp. L-A4 TaxID=2304600 RepID=UPI000E35DBF0|nr:TadE/TadG family type IV pilus assembly protein [Breoghania sp. L-A4]AXS38893.1 pilus assembly protein [Breoghania sp. L-A4]
MSQRHSVSASLPKEPARRPSFVGRLRRFRRNESGSTAIEFALVAMPFLVLLAFLIEIGLVFFAGEVLDNAVAESARLIRTGQAQKASLDADGFKQEVMGHLPGFFSADRLSIDVKTYTSFSTWAETPLIDEDDKLIEDFSYQTGSASQIVVMRAFYRWPMAGSYFGVDFSDLADGTRLIASIAAFRNEPFPTASGGS